MLPLSHFNVLAKHRSGFQIPPPRIPYEKQKHPKEGCFCFSLLRGRDLNPRPSGYEPDELPDCSTPLYFGHYNTLLMTKKVNVLSHVFKFFKHRFVQSNRVLRVPLGKVESTALVGYGVAHPVRIPSIINRSEITAFHGF